jgi:AcrR family transcriptional regulator
MARDDEEWRKLVINYALTEFKRCGINAVTMDKVAYGLGMSKRTLYKMFGDKATLVEECLNSWVHSLLETQSRARIVAERMRDVDTGSTSRKLLVMIHKFIEELYRFSDNFLNDIHKNPEWSIYERYYVKVWSDEVARLVRRCMNERLIMQVGNYNKMTDKALMLLTTLRRQNEPKKEVWQFCVINLRGITLENEQQFIHKTVLS